MNIAAYCRVSTDKSDQLNSLDAQKIFFEEYALKHGHTLVKLYADEGISGTKIKNRKEFQKLMQDAPRGMFEMVVVKDISRFARNTVDLLSSTRQLKALNIETMFLTGNMTVLGNSEFLLTIFGALAQEESANTSKRVKFGKKLNAEKGRVPNMVYGYDKTKGDYFNLQINEREAAVVRRIYGLYIKEGYGASKIAQMFNGEGLQTKRGCAWSQNGVSRILTNELYTGKIINGKQEVTDFLTGIRRETDKEEWLVTERPDLRIIEPEVFEQAQKILAGRYESFKVSNARHSNKFLFSTLIKCAECGYSYRRLTLTYKNTYVRWVCSGRNTKGVDFCGNTVTIQEEELIESLRNYFVGVLENQEDITKRVVKEFTRVYKAQSDNREFEKELRDKLSKAQQSRDRYLDIYKEGLFPKEDLRKKVSALNVEITKLEDKLKLVSYNLSKGDQLEGLLKKTFKTVNDVVSMETISNAQLKQIVHKIIVNMDNNVDIHLKLLSDIGLDESFIFSDANT
jgi:DNA invertase Pin-like site-specific DNA recombinase